MLCVLPRFVRIGLRFCLDPHGARGTEVPRIYPTKPYIASGAVVTCIYLGNHSKAWHTPIVKLCQRHVVIYGPYIKESVKNGKKEVL
jgi:hypothetical protein